jgi:hypothetical protein
MVNFFQAHPPWHIAYLPQGSVNPHFVHRIIQPGALSSGVIISISEHIINHHQFSGEYVGAGDFTMRIFLKRYRKRG